MISTLVRQAGDRLRVVAGAGVTAENLSQLIARTDAREFHASVSATRVAKMRWRNPRLRGLQANYDCSDAERVRRMVEVLQKEY